MSRIGALQELMERLVKTPTSAVARLAATKKVEPLTPQEIERIANAEVVLRRKHTGDILGEKRRMANVHESRKTAAAAGPDLSREIRGKFEPEMFGGTDVNYGYLTEDPLSTTKRPLMIHYPKKGANFLTPDDVLTQYGQYGFRLSPQGRARTTFTLGDSLDAGRGPYTTAGDLIKPPGPWHDLAMMDSELYQLAKAYDDKRTAIFETLSKGKEWYQRPDPAELDDWMKREGFSGSFKDFLRDRAGVEGLGAQYPRMVPRPLADPGALPLLPTERYGLDISNKGEGIDALLKRDRPGTQTGYLEAQVLGGVGPGDVDRLYDFGFEPSLALEKKARKFGLDYVPMPEDNLYNLVQRAQPRTMGELADLLGPDKFDEWRYYTADTGPQRNPKMLWEARGRDVPKFGRGFEKGGSVKNFKPQTRAPKGALCACGDNLGPHFLAADGGSVPESRAPWAPQPGFTDPTWSDLLKELAAAAPDALRKARDNALRYMAGRAAPYYGGQRQVDGAGNLKEQLDMAAGALRGAAGATAGLPGDLQSLARGAMAAPQGPLATLSAMERETALPTSGDLLRNKRGYLARGAGTPGEKSGETLGEFLPLVPPSAVRSGARAVGRGAERVGRGIEGATERALQDPGIRGDLVRRFGPMLQPPVAHAVKPRGGNFDQGALHRWLADLGVHTPEFFDMGGDAPGPGRDELIQEWGRKQLANYVRKDLGAPTDPLLAVEREIPGLHLPENGDLRTHFRLDADRVNDHLAAIRNAPPLPAAFHPHKSETDGLYRALDTESGEIFGKGSATPEEGMREAAVDFALSQVRGRGTLGKIARKHAALTQDPMTPWGMMSGRAIDTYDSPSRFIEQTRGELTWAASLLPGGKRSSPEYIAEGGPDRAAAHAKYIQQAIQDGVPEWLTRAAPDTKFYGGLDDTLGFDHVLDYLEAATKAQGLLGDPGYVDTVRRLGPQMRNPGAMDREAIVAVKLLDAGLTLDPASLSRLSVADAVRKTAQWNKFMADQGAADGPLSKGWKEFKAYPGDAGKGMRWVEFGKGDTSTELPELPEGVAPKPAPGGGYYVPGSAPVRTEYGMSEAPAIARGRTPEEAVQNARAALAQKQHEAALREGLGAEGDAMGHCVGGYCDDVLSRGTKIYSLRDAKGKPHVTIEVRPQQTRKTPADAKWDSLPEDERQDIKKTVGASMGVPYAGVPDGRLDEFIARMDEELKRRYPELVGATLPPEIVQIKGKGNAAPVADYLPFVQDFVRSGKWGRVGDLRNTGLVHFSGGKTRYRTGMSGGPDAALDGKEFSMPSGYMTPQEAAKHLIDQGAPADWARGHVGDFDKFASGGRVEPDEAPGFIPRDFDEMVAYAERVFDGA